MTTAYYIIADNGDGSQRVEWYKGTDWSVEQLLTAAELDKYGAYASEDGVQLTILDFPESFDLNSIKGIFWEDYLPGTSCDT